ncbi:MAG: hypothetical protein CMN76_06035 [Spirochaetaceae bacterium]|nr:hypothetical protein [Spirochaetaceae bacterium]
MEPAQLFLLEPGTPLPDQGFCPNFGQGYRPDLYCPEIRMREALKFSIFWQYAGDLDESYKNEIPYWCIVWPGSRMLARYALDHGSDLELKGKRVLELGCGSGLAAVAFASMGATVVATDHDRQALRVAEEMARQNGCQMETDSLELFDEPDEVLKKHGPDLMILGDLFYESRVAERVKIWCRQASERGIKCIVADPFRTYGPHKEPQSWSLKLIREGQVPVHPSVENAKSRRTALLMSESSGPGG